MRKTLFFLFLMLIPTALAQNITTTTGQLPANYTIGIEIRDLTENDTIGLWAQEWITLQTDNITIEGTNYTFEASISIPFTEEGNYTKKIFYNATGYSNLEIPIEIEIRNDTETYQAFLENEQKKYYDCIINKLKDTNNNSTARMRAEYDCRYEVTNNPNGTILIQKETVTEEKPVINEETQNKISTIDATTTGINTEISNIKTDINTLKTDILNRIQNMEDNLTSQTQEEENNPSNSKIDWTTFIIIVGIAVLAIMVVGLFIIKKKKSGFQE